MIRKNDIAKFIILACLIFILSVGIGELYIRRRIKSPLPYNLIGYTAFSAQMDRFKSFIAGNGVPNCIIFGNSLVQAGVSPVVFQEAFSARSGIPVTCFNFGMDAATMSSMKTVALMVIDTYHPEIVVVGVSGAQFNRLADENPSHVAENEFNTDNWIRYRTGHFNLEGWLIENSNLYRYLIKKSRRTFPQTATKITTPAAIRPVIKRIVDDDGYEPLISYKDSAPMFGAEAEQYALISFDVDDWLAYQEFVQAAQEDDFQLVFIEMPTFLASEKIDGIIDQARDYAIGKGVPFLSMREMDSLPVTAYADPIHMHISGSIVFSEWLGEKLGGAYVDHEFDQASTSVWIPHSEDWPAATYWATFGLSEASYAKYERILEQNTEAYAGSILLNPDAEEINRPFLQMLLGFEAEWERGADDQSRQEMFDLISMLAIMQYKSEIEAAGLEPGILERWERELDAGPLLENDIRFVLCRQELVDPQIPHCPLGIYDHPDYEMIKSWDFKPLHEQYHLFKINP